MHTRLAMRIPRRAFPAMLLGIFLLAPRAAAAQPQPRDSPFAGRLVPALGSAPSYAYVTNSEADTVKVLDTSTNSVVDTIDVGKAPVGVAVAAGGELVYVANSGEDTVSIIDAETDAVEGTVEVGSQPRYLAVTPDGKRVYVANASSGNASVIDTETRNVIKTIPIGSDPQRVAVTPDGAYVYVTDGYGEDVAIVSTATDEVVADLPSPAFPSDVVIPARGGFAYVAYKEVLGSFGGVSAIDGSTLSEAWSLGIGGSPYGIIASPDGTRVYLGHLSGEISVIEPATEQVLALIGATAGGYAMAITPDGKYVYSLGSEEVAVVSTASNSVVTYLKLGQGLEGIATEPPPPPAEPPSVVTELATDVTSTTAVLSGNVDPNGSQVTACAFEYGNTPTYGHSVACSGAPGSGDASVPVTAAIEGLEPATTYHFKLVATNANGTSAGADETLRTTAPPPTVVTEAPTIEGATQATLRGLVTPNGAQVTECVFEIGTSSLYEWGPAPCSSLPGSGTSPVPVSVTIGGLEPGVTYHYRVRARNEGGSTAGLDEAFETLHPPTVSTTAASGVTQTTAVVHGTADPHGAEALGCVFEFGPSTSYGYGVSCASLPPAASFDEPVSATLTGLAPHTTYHFRALAANAAGWSPGGDETFTTPPFPPTVITRPASGETSTAATLNGLVDPNGGLLSECVFEYGTTTSYGAQAPCNPSPGSAEAYVPVSVALSGLSPGSTYHYRIEAQNAGGASLGYDGTFLTAAGSPTGPEGKITWRGPTAKAKTASVPVWVTADGVVSWLELEDALTLSATAAPELLPPLASAPALSAFLPSSFTLQTSFGTVSVDLDSGSESGAAMFSATPPFPEPPQVEAASLADVLDPVVEGSYVIVPLGKMSRTLTLTFAGGTYSASLEHDTLASVRFTRLAFAVVTVTTTAVILAALPAIAATIAETLADRGIVFTAGAILNSLKTAVAPLLRSAAASSAAELVSTLSRATLAAARSAWATLSRTPLAIASMATAQQAAPTPAPSLARVLRLRRADLRGLRAQILRGARATAAKSSLLMLPANATLAPLVASRRLPRTGALTVLAGGLRGKAAQLVIAGPGYSAVRNLRVRGGVAGARVQLPSPRRPGRWYAGIVDYSGLGAAGGKLAGSAVVHAATWNVP